MNTLKITLPIPHSDLFPNGGTPYFLNKSKRTKKARADAGYAALDAMNREGVEAPRWERATTQVTFWFRVERRRDRDNAAASLKAYWDGIADAGVVRNDAGLTHMPPVLLVDKGNPRVEIQITKGGA